MCLFRSVYHGDPDDETLLTFYAMLHRIPDSIKIEWGYGGEGSLEETAERMEHEGVQMAKWDGLAD